MKTGGILLAGGQGTRLYPNTKVINKHLLPIYDKPMIYYSLSILLLSKIKDITLICNPKDELDYRNLLGDGEELGVNINYSLQDSPEGIPHAIYTALQVSNYDRFMTVLGDNFLYGREFFTSLEKVFFKTEEVSIYYQKVRNPELYGVIKWKGNIIEDLVEKPTNFLSNDAVIGLYIFDSNFSNHFKNLKKSNRGEFEIIDIIKEYVLDNISSNYVGRGTAWFDMGSSEDFFNSSQFVKTIQDRQGLLVCSPHEIAYRNGYINSEKVENYIKSIEGSEYASNLSRTILQ